MIIHNSSIASVLVGDCLASLKTLPAGSVNCCVTSPPYYGLRDYGHEGQIGLEETPDAYIARLVEVFREVRRTLRDDGTLWLNIGDSYVGSANNGGAATKTMSGPQAATGKNLPTKRGEGLKSKDLIGIPWMLAFALRADGWYLRQDIIWHKPNPMPESVRDRCTKAHEYVFLLSKSDRYYYDHEAVKEPTLQPRGEPKKTGQIKSEAFKHSGTLGSNQGSEFRNRRSVWTVAPRPYSGAHFAVYPPELIEPCILAGCPPGGLVLDPFGGSGTTAGVALAHGRNAMMCELNPEYAALMPERVKYITDRLAPVTLRAAA